MLGLTVMSSGARTQRSVLMTLEGFVVFDGEYDGGLTVHRALPPFDSPHLPPGSWKTSGSSSSSRKDRCSRAADLEDGAMVRRHRMPDGGSIDVEALPAGDWRIRRYDPSETLTRTVRGRHGPGRFFRVPARPSS